jgi:uncharacterized protein
MEKVRPSSYLNHIDIGDGTSLLVNGATMCIDLVPTEYAVRLTDKSFKNNLSFLSPDEKNHLIIRGHLTVWSRSRELEEFKKMVRSTFEKGNERKKKKGYPVLSFILTYNCNLSCSYCFQKSLADKSPVPPMTESFVDDFFLNYMPQMFPSVPMKNISILLFGGEPLLTTNRDTIARILYYARKFSFKVATATNALTLSGMADFIGPENGKIQTFQVTLDGDRQVHDSQRVTHSGEPTFDDMIMAIQELIRLKACVYIRMHIHPGRLDSAEKLIEHLEKAKILRHPLVEVYFAPINPFNMESFSKESAIFSDLFQRVALKTKRPPTINLDFLNNVLQIQNKKLHFPRMRFCSLGNDSTRIIDPLGDIYDCFEEAGHKDRRIGVASHGKLEYFKLKETYSKRHILNIPECLRCSVALFCGGGCPNQARIQLGTIFKPNCHVNKYYIMQTLKAYYLLSKNEGASTSCQ